MTLTEAVAALEAECIVHDVAGYAVGDYDGPLDMTRAPNGEKYVWLTSGGLKKHGQPVLTWFSDDEEAISWWKAEAMHLRAKHAETPHLFWLHKPTFARASFVNVAQAEALNDDRLRESLSVELRFVSSWLLLSAKEPTSKPIEG
jgi:hypothetical protein